MKKVVLVFLIMTIPWFTYSQNNDDYERLRNNKRFKEGYVLKKDSTLIEGLIKTYHASAKKFDRVVFIHKDSEAEVFYPSELMSYGYDNFELVAGMSSFYQKVVSGEKVSIYRSMLSYPAYGSQGVLQGYGAYNTGSFSSGEDLYFCKNGETKFVLTKTNQFEHIFGKYFEDCPLLRQKIVDREISENDLLKIMEMYNTCDLQ